jgi:hypothetical protein
MAYIRGDIVFTDWRTVKLNSVEEIRLSTFLKKLDRNYKNDNYSVYYYEGEKKFIITYNGYDYEVILPTKSKEKLLNGEYTPLVYKLLYLSLIEKEYKRQKEMKEANEEKLSRIKDSFYEELESLDDYRLYLDSLERDYKKAKTKDERDVINTKKDYVCEKIKELQREESQKENNPLNLRFHVNRFIYNLLSQARLLNDKERVRVGNILKGIILDYKKNVSEYYSDDNKLKLGNPLLSLDILGRIVDVEFLVEKLMAKYKVSSVINPQLFNIVSDLQQSVGKGEK